MRLGDKGAGFLGSSQWIGAVELGYILDDYLGVEYKVLGWLCVVAVWLWLCVMRRGGGRETSRERSRGRAA